MLVLLAGDSAFVVLPRPGVFADEPGSDDRDGEADGERREGRAAGQADSGRRREHAPMPEPARSHPRKFAGSRARTQSRVSGRSPHTPRGGGKAGLGFRACRTDASVHRRTRREPARRLVERCDDQFTHAALRVAFPGIRRGKRESHGAGAGQRDMLALVQGRTDHSCGSDSAQARSQRQTLVLRSPD